MTYITSVNTDDSPNLFIVQKTSYPLNTSKSIPDPTKKLPRSQSQVNSSSYIRSLRRAFTRAKVISFFNPDMIYFLTFTYHTNETDPDKVLYDIKQFLKKERRNN